VLDSTGCSRVEEGEAVLDSTGCSRVEEGEGPNPTREGRQGSRQAQWMVQLEDTGLLRVRKRIVDQDTKKTACYRPGQDPRLDSIVACVPTGSTADSQPRVDQPHNAAKTRSTYQE
jgi:hypothetical protein